MGLKLFTISSELESARRLGLPTFTGEIPEYLDFYKGDICIRWGNSRSVFNKRDEKKEFPHVLQTSKAIRANCDKYASKKKLEEAGISVPKTYIGTIPSGIKCVVRPFEHSSGKEFSIKTGPCEIGSEEYGSEYLRSKKEVRIWFVGRSTLMARRCPLKGTEEKDQICRSNWGYDFCYGDKVPKDIFDSIMKGAEKLNLKFGAVDAILQNGVAHILEYNTACSIDLVRLERFFKKGLMKLLRDEFGKDFEKLAELNKLKKDGYKFADSDF
jgi:predicted ATP-grasp superfamily ATP-dependent carboligase